MARQYRSTGDRERRDEKEDITVGSRASGLGDRPARGGRWDGGGDEVSWLALNGTLCLDGPRLGEPRWFQGSSQTPTQRPVLWDSTTASITS